MGELRSEGSDDVHRMASFRCERVAVGPGSGWRHVAHLRDVPGDDAPEGDVGAPPLQRVRRVLHAAGEPIPRDGDQSASSEAGSEQHGGRDDSVPHEGYSYGHE